MKKTVDISLAGILFHVEEDAYYKLKKYLKSVRHSLGNPVDADEVMNEIEARIAELLMEKQAHPQQVINTQHIDEIISVMGQPEDYEEQIEPVEKKERINKSLFRDVDNSSIGGVAAGLAHYTGLDVTLMRILFIILLFVTHGGFLLIYLLLWIIIPKAKTASDKLKMKGESVNVDNIAEQFTAGEEIGKKKMNIAEKVEDGTQEFGKIIIRILGFLLALISGVLLLGLILSVAGLSSFTDTDLVIENKQMLETLNISFGWLTALFFILAGIPVALLFLLGIKMLFPNVKSLNKNIIWVSAVVWFLALLFVISKSKDLTRHENSNAQIKVFQTAWSQSLDTLFVQTKIPVEEKENSISDNRIYYRFHPAADQKFHLEISYFSEGRNRRYARNNARKIQFEYRIDSTDNRLVFAGMMSYPNDNFLIDRKVYVDIYIPQGKFIKTDENYSGFGEFSYCEPPFVLANEQAKIICKSPEQIRSLKKEEVIRINAKNLRLKLDDNGVEIYSGSDTKAQIKIDEHGVIIKARDDKDSLGVEINENGIRVKQND